VPSDEERKKGAERILTKLDVFEVSPVLVGAGVGTRTLAAKAADEESAAKAAQEKADAEAREAAELAARQEAETKAQQARVKVAMDEYHRTQRSLKRMGLVA
jgi:hypothetical protein